MVQLAARLILIQKVPRSSRGGASRFRNKPMIDMLFTCGSPEDRRSFILPLPENRHLAIMLSSGADSSILLYLICSELIKQGRSIDEVKYIFTVPKSDGADLHSPGIVAAINEMLNINLPAPTIFGAENVQELPHTQQIEQSVRAVFGKYAADGKLFVYLADNRETTELVLSPDEKLYRVDTNPSPELLGMPFIELMKSHTIDLHFMHGTERLLELSHSCTQQTSGRCGRCYHCRERQWAFDQLGKTDPGNN